MAPLLGSGTIFSLLFHQPPVIIIMDNSSGDGPPSFYQSPNRPPYQTHPPYHPHQNSYDDDYQVNNGSDYYPCHEEPPYDNPSRSFGYSLYQDADGENYYEPHGGHSDYDHNGPMYDDQPDPLVEEIIRLEQKSFYFDELLFAEGSWYEPPYSHDYTLFAEEQIEANKVAIRERAKLLESVRKEKEFERRLCEGSDMMQKMLDDFQRERLEAEAKADKLVNDLCKAVELKRSLQSQDQMREINVQKEALEPKTNLEPINQQVPVLEDSPNSAPSQKPESITTLARATMVMLPESLPSQVPTSIVVHEVEPTEGLDSEPPTLVQEKKEEEVLLTAINDHLLNCVEDKPPEEPVLEEIEPTTYPQDSNVQESEEEYIDEEIPSTEEPITSIDNHASSEDLDQTFFDSLLDGCDLVCLKDSWIQNSWDELLVSDTEDSSLGEGTIIIIQPQTDSQPIEDKEEISLAMKANDVDQLKRPPPPPTYTKSPPYILLPPSRRDESRILDLDRAITRWYQKRVKKKLEAKCSSPAFYQSYLEMIAAQELSEFLQMKIRLKYEEEVLEFYRNGEVKTVHSKKDPQRTIQVIKSTVGRTKVKLSQKKLGEKLHLPNSGVEIGKFPVKNLDWNIIGISGQAPSSPAKKADLNNDYKLVLELVIKCLECGNGGLYIGYILESMGVASDGKKYEERYWLYYLSSKGENRAAASATAEESSSDNVPLINLTKTAKRKQVVSPSLSIEAPLNLALVNLEEEEEVFDQGELQRKKKRKIISPSTSGNVNPDELKEKEPAEETSAHNRNPQQLEEEIPQVQSLPTPSPQPQTDDAENQFCCEEILDDYWVWQRNYEDLHLEHLATSPVSDFEVDDEDTAVYKPVFSKATENQVVLTTEAQANLEATAEDFQIFPETSPAFETVLTEAVQENISNQPELEIPEKSAEIPEQSAFPETNEEEQAVEVQRNSAEAEKEVQTTALEASETPVEVFKEQNEAEERDSLSMHISNFVLDKAEEESKRIVDEEDLQEDAESLPMQIVQRTPSSHQVNNLLFHSSSIPTLPDEVPEIGTRKIQGLIESALASQHASFRQEIEQMKASYTKQIEKSEEKHSADLKKISKSEEKTLEIISLLSKTVSNTMDTYASDSYLQLKEINKVKEQIASVTVGLQKQMSLLQMDIRSALEVSSANQVVTKDYLKVIIDNQKEAFKLFRLLSTNSGNRKMEVILQQHSPSLIPELPIAVKEGEVSYIPSHLNMTDLILEAQQSNPENSAQHLSSSGLDGTEAIGTIVAHFSNDVQTEERRNNLRCIKELCGNMQGISETA
ncbi:unnamed protein product [Cuscuta campestris]|uniref:Uncharacterized protein n=1 Tax=Cuscuta campestris TaxID=132261 RepID=A0A484MNR8_9ASTE|nr:unnamed protein product [Cuscuta campestris]